MPKTSGIKKKRVNSRRDSFWILILILFCYWQSTTVPKDLDVAGQVCQVFKEVAENIFFRKYNGHCSLAEDNCRGSKWVKLNKIEMGWKLSGQNCVLWKRLQLDCIKKYYIILYFCKDINENVEKELKIEDFHFDNSMVENVNLLLINFSMVRINCSLTVEI